MKQAWRPSGQPGRSSRGCSRCLSSTLLMAALGTRCNDFVAVFASVLDFDVQLLHLAFDSYASSVDVAAVWPDRGVTNSAAYDAGMTRASSGAGRQHGGGVSGNAAPQHAGLAPNRVLAAVGDEVNSSQAGGSSSSSTGRHCSSVSHAFMVYLLLHEEGGVVGQLLEQQPQLRACGGLQEMQQQLFGWMDCWWAAIKRRAVHGQC
ncbi:hypothetical protein COO60DRAFT_521918 [Scenedesmus sp. NREL 46B-D3]|nr:hypothetical protein COO60DRAFT_521918 [Scenedesmus sp. NREL 46B-D3]